VDLDRAFAARTVVKATLMRSTLHAVSAADYRRLLPAVMPMPRGSRRQDRAEPPTEPELRALRAAAAAFTTEPRSLTDIGRHLADLDLVPGRPPDELVWWLRRFAPLVHAPGSDTVWSFGRRPRLVDARAWLDGAVDPLAPATTDALDYLVRRYLAAFGPATAADIGAWSGLPIGTLRPAIAALQTRGELWHARDERGRALLDRPGSPRPDPATPSPPRLLPMWDSVLLAHADRTRIISDADRAVVIARNGDTLPTFLVDGLVAGLWWAHGEPGGRTRIVIEPFRPLDPEARRALEREGERLAAFVEPLEPTVYARYQRWRPRR